MPSDHRFITYLNRVYQWAIIPCKLPNYSHPSASEGGDCFGRFWFPVNLANIDLLSSDSEPMSYNTFLQLWTRLFHVYTRRSHRSSSLI